MSSESDRRRRQREHSLAVHAKLLCSAVFVVGRNPYEYIENDLRTMAHVHDWGRTSVDLDHERETVTLSTDEGHSKTAAYNGSQGCTLLPEGESSVHFDPVEVEPALPPADEQAWPMGDRNATATEGVDSEALAATLDRTVSDDPPGELPPGTRAVVVLRHGKIVGERYAPGFDADTRHVSWSMGKSVTAALAGILVREGHLDVDERAPIDAWLGDPREEIAIDDLLRMSSGLDCGRAGDDGETTPLLAEDHHHRVYFDPIDVFEFATGRPLSDEPGTAWRYRNCDTLSLGKVVRDTVEATGREYLSFPQRALYDHIGVRNMVHEPDPWGNFISTGFNYGTARDWARFGLLHLRDGVWQGERLLPEGWVDYVSTPAPAAPEDQYGAQFWVNAGNALPDVPGDAFSARGARGQLTMVIPSLDAVVVRLGHTPDHEDAQHDALVGAILDCLT